MPTAHFSELLKNRREQLRLTIPQAAKVLRMRESVLIGFEAGDFQNLPPLGYAQGMIASYARYLGLDPLELTSLYEEEHAEYIAAVSGSRPTGLASLSDEPGYRGPASAALSPNNNITASPAQGLGTPLRRIPSVPLPQRPDARDRSARDTSFYDQTTNRTYTAPAERRYSDEIRYGSATSDAPESRERRYTQRSPQAADDRLRRTQAGRVRRARTSTDYGSSYGARPASSGSSSQYSSEHQSYSSRYSSYRDDIQTRYASSEDYRDDLRYDSGATSYRASSTRDGRVASRSGTPVQRPNVRRQSSRATQQQNSLREAYNQGGILGAVQTFFADPQRAILTIGVVLGLVLLIVLVTSVRSCVGAASSSQRQSSVVTTLAATTEQAATTTSAEEQQVLSAAAAQKAASVDAAAYTETVVKVSVADGATSWVEITTDGQQTVAESITGPWEVEYTVKQSITIQVVDASSVTVEKNGVQQTFSTKSAGLSSITIEGTDPEAAAAATAAATTAETDDSEE